VCVFACINRHPARCASSLPTVLLSPLLYTELCTGYMLPIALQARMLGNLWCWEFFAASSLVGFSTHKIPHSGTVRWLYVHSCKLLCRDLEKAIGLSSGWPCAAQNSKFRFLEVASPDPQKIHAKCHRRWPSGLAALEFWQEVKVIWQKAPNGGPFPG